MEGLAAGLTCTVDVIDGPAGGATINSWCGAMGVVVGRWGDAKLGRFNLLPLSYYRI
jgi:hypothetical protein